MRSINRSIPKTETVEVVKVATSEVLAYIVEQKPMSRIEVVIHFNDANGLLLESEMIEIAENNYELLMSESPSFAPGKPQNEYREEDLWHVIDQIRSA